MEKRNRFLQVAYFALAASIVISCAATQQSTVRTQTRFDDVWKACLAAVVDIGYAVSSTDSNAGVIVAEQAVVLGGGTAARLNIAVNRAGNNTEVRVSFIRPPLTIGGFGTAKEYVEALRKRIPDIQVVEVK